MFIFIVIIILLLLFYLNNKEQFSLSPLFYMSSPSTRNMSYDLRCEPKIPKKNFYFRGSSIMPKTQYKCLNI